MSNFKTHAYLHSRMLPTTRLDAQSKQHYCDLFCSALTSQLVSWDSSNADVEGTNDALFSVPLELSTQQMLTMAYKMLPTSSIRTLKQLSQQNHHVKQQTSLPLDD